MSFTTAEQPAIIRRIFRDSDSRVQFIDSNGDVVHVASYQAEIQITSLELGVIAVAPLYFSFAPFYFSIEDLTEIDVDGTATNYGASGSPAYTEPTLDFEEVKAKVRDVYEQLATEVFYECCAGSGGGGGTSTTTNNYSSLADPQLFNPDASGVSGNTDDFTLATTNSVAFVTINGQVLDDSEYSLLGDVLTVTPDNGFSDITDEVLVWQHTFSTSSTGGDTKNLVRINSAYTLLATDYYVEAYDGTFTISLLTAVGIPGQAFEIYNTGSGTITLDADGSETVAGSATFALSPGESLKIVSNGINFIG